MKITSVTVLLLLFLLLKIPPGSGMLWAKSKNGPCEKVQRVIDGDTLKLANGEKVRLLGIDSPETQLGEKIHLDSLFTRRSVAELMALGRQASELTKSLVEGRTVCLRFGGERIDPYGRTLAYVFFKMREGELQNIVGHSPPGNKKGKKKNYLLNRILVEYGYAEVFRRTSFKYREEFEALEASAKQKHWGIWREAAP